MKKYENPKLEIILLEKDNVIVCSDPLGNFGADAFFPVEWGEGEKYFGGLQ